MKQEPLVSVVIPVYNVAPYLRESLDSVLNQTYSNLDIIIVDDGSTDGSGDICDEYKKDSRVIVLHQKNRGLSAARNAGLDLIRGEYIAFLDSDDAYDPDFIRVMVQEMLCLSPDIVVCGCRVCRTVGELKLSVGEGVESSAPQGMYDRAKALRAVIDGKITCYVWNKLYRRRLWEYIRFPDGHNYEDVDTMCRIFDLCQKVYVLDKPLYLYRKRPGSITETFSVNNANDHNLALARMESFIEDHIPEIFTQDHLKKSRQLRLNVMMRQYVLCKDKDFVETIKEEIQPLVQETGLNQYRIKTRFAYRLLCSCPWLLRLIYPGYHAVKVFLWRITGRWFF